MKKKNNSKQNRMTGKASWEWACILAKPVIPLLRNIKSSVLSLKWQSPSSNIVSASNQKKSWWGCEEADCSTKLVSASAFHLGMQHTFAQVTKSKSTQSLGKSPAGSPFIPSLHCCLLKPFLCTWLPKTRSLVSLGGIQWAKTSHLSQGHCSPRRPCPAPQGISALSVSYLSTCPQLSGWYRPGETLLLLFHLLRSLTCS